MASSFCKSLIYGAGDRSRTDDLLITNQLLYQLSYTGFILDLPPGQAALGLRRTMISIPSIRVPSGIGGSPLTSISVALMSTSCPVTTL